jgi:hypothetical protein
MRNGTAQFFRASAIVCQSAPILEIAPGFGRWTHYFKGYCDVDRRSVGSKKWR